jgi:hypothetical protein
VQWQPTLSVAVIDAAVWGTTVAGACAARLIDAASSASSLPPVTEAVSAVLLAGVSEAALAPVLRALDAVAAIDEDVTSLMTAVPSLVRAIRYGTVRGTPAGSLSAVVDALVIRVCAGLPGAVGGLADDAAAGMRAAMDEMHGALALYRAGAPVAGLGAGTDAGLDGGPDGGAGSGPGAWERWIHALGGLAGRRGVHGLVAGRVARMLADAGAVTWAEAATRFRAALSVGVAPAAKAAWAEGFLGGASGGGAPGGGLLLVHDTDLLAVLDEWVASLGSEEFVEVLPLLRRTFGGFTQPERAAVGRAARALSARRGSGADGSRPGEAADAGVDAARAAGALRTVALILGGSSSVGDAAGIGTGTRVGMERAGL